MKSPTAAVIFSLLLFISSVLLLVASSEPCYTGVAQLTAVSSPATGVLPLWIQPSRNPINSTQYYGTETVYYVYGSCYRNATGACVNDPPSTWTFRDIRGENKVSTLIGSGSVTHTIACACSLLALALCASWGVVARRRINLFDKQNQRQHAYGLRLAATVVAWSAALVALVGMSIDLYVYAQFRQLALGPKALFGSCLGVMIASALILLGAATGLSYHCAFQDSLWTYDIVRQA